MPRQVFLFILFFLSACRSDAGPAEPPVPLGVEVGQRAPAVQGTLAGGQAFRLDPAASGPTVLVFYRSAGCGLCRVQLMQLQTHLSAYDRVGAAVVALTLDPPEVSLTVLEPSTLGFPLVSVDTATFERWEVMHPDRPLALPASYVIDATGIVRYRHIGRNAADRASDAELVTVLEGLSGG